MENNPKQLTKSHNHDHFFIEEMRVYECYRTLRGLRYRSLADVIMEDKELLNEEDIKKVNEILKAN